MSFHICYVYNDEIQIEETVATHGHSLVLVDDVDRKRTKRYKFISA
jgi:hypothetical protein